jgi:hypothetical protein
MSKKTKKPARRSAGKPRPAAPSVDTASRIIKRAAAKQRIVISLTNEQFETLVQNFRPEGVAKFDPRKPFQIEFEATGIRRSRLPVASCAFWSDTCCA